VETRVHYGLSASVEVLLTSAQGDKMAQVENIHFHDGIADRNVIEVRPDVLKQSLLGIGTSFTESAAFVLAHLAPECRAEVMANLFSAQGANFSLGRTPIGSCDFCVNGNYSYADVPGDMELQHFSVVPDEDGFAVADYPGIRDPQYDLLPMIQEAQAIKAAQQDADLRIVASAWTAPAWMKDIETWYQPGTPANGFNGTGGVLKAECQPVFAEYIIRYLESYRQRGVQTWGITPVNEPLGNNGQWESMHFTPDSQRLFVRDHLGPLLRKRAKDVQLLIYDHARDQLEQWADSIYGDTEAACYVAGAAVHWYESTFRVYEDVFERVHAKYPDYFIIHTEGCIDDLGKDAPEGVTDPVRFKESGWFGNDDFWWNDNATDWGYSVIWSGVNAADHPIYTPVHRYARNIIVSLNHWLNGWIDWNCVLDQRGGPNHVGNYCGAPIMVDLVSGQVYYTPVFHVLAQFSRTIRPGDRVVQTSMLLDDQAQHVYACASMNAEGMLSVQVLNTYGQPLVYALQVGAQYAQVRLAANALQTLRIQFPRR